MSSKISDFLLKYWYIFGILGIVGIYETPTIIQGLTSVETLTIEFHEASKFQYRIVAICKDGWNSRATGRGACSHHGGVSEWQLKTEYRRTIENCRAEAKEKSWLD